MKDGKAYLEIYSLSDIHLGNRSVSTQSIIRNLTLAIPDSPEMANVDIIFLAGDVTDEALLLADECVIEIQLWIVRLLTICKKWDIVLRVLEGTPSHDRKQSKQFMVLNTACNIHADVQYVDQLSIEHIERFNINVLYVPDEWRANAEITQHEVMDLMENYQLDQVDYAVMHGTFPYQCPMINSMSSHSEDFYLQIVRKYIFIGHFHVPSQRKRILAQGSFDRLTHNEEHDKGFYHVIAYHDSFENDQVIFKINQTAAIFKTIDLINCTRLEAHMVLQDICDHNELTNSDQKRPIYVRIKCVKNDPNEDVILSFKKGYPKIKWSTKVVSVNQEQERTHREPKVFVPTIINENTILSLIEKRLKISDHSDQFISDTIDLLKTIKGGV